MANFIQGLLAKAGPMGQAIQMATGMSQAIRGGNPMAALMQNDPRMKQVIDYINQFSGNAEQAFYALAKQKGVDPNEALNQARSMIGQ